MYVHRTARTLAGEQLSSAWVDDAEDLPEQRPRRLLARQFPSQPWEGTRGLECAPFCAACGSTTVWRGKWECQGCAARGARLSDTLSGGPPALPREALAGVPIFSTSEGNNSTERSSWLWAVESLTSFHRQKCAGHLRMRGTRPAETTVDDDTGEVTQWPPYLSQWHQQRIQGQAERFERIASCGAFEYALEITDETGTRSQPIRKRCDCWRACQNCLNRRKYLLAAGMKRQRAEVLRKHYRETHRRYRGKEGKWSEKLITFTVPHGESGPGEDAQKLVNAWQQMLRRVRRHLVDRGAIRLSPSGKPVAVSVPWCRALEVAPGNTGGHAHLHVWWFGPFLDVALLSLWWGEILVQSAGCVGVPRVRAGEVIAKGRDSRLRGWLGNPADDDMVPRGIVDIFSDRGVGRTGAYASKVGIALYITKGTETSRIEPAHAASVYEALEGVRATQWARGWAPPKKPLRAFCVTLRRLTAEEKENLNHAAITQNTSANLSGVLAICGTGAMAVSAADIRENVQVDMPVHGRDKTLQNLRQLTLFEP